MKEIRWHGRGGQGGFTAARVLGLAAVKSGNFAQAFPSFGPERRGAPVLGFTRIDSIEIDNHSQVYSCDCVVVLDETLIGTVDVTKGLKPGGILIINTKNPREQYENLIKEGQKLYVFDGTSLALEYLKNPIVNTVMLGAVIAVTGFVTIKSAEIAIERSMTKELREKNKAALLEAYSRVKEGKSA